MTEGRGASCLSACAFVFLGGYDFYSKSPWRTKATTSVLGFHSYFLTLDKELYSASEVREMLLASQYSALLLVQYFREVDADMSILTAALSKTSSEIHYISNSEALEAGINVWDEDTDQMVLARGVARYTKQ